MKKILLLLLLFTYCYVLTAQTKLQGCYYNESGMYFEFDDGQYKLVMPNNILFSEILSEGELHIIDKHWGELNYKESPFIEAIKSVKITQEQKMYSPKDSISINFKIPYRNGKLYIAIYTDNFKMYNMVYKEKETTVCKIASNVHKVGFTIRPEYIIPQTGEGEFCGIVEVNSLEYEILNNNNSIQIEIPAINNSFFEKMYLKHEYIRIKENTIIWKGEEFVKK